MKNILSISSICFFLICNSFNSFSQCIAGAAFGTGAAPALGATTTLSGGIYAGEYSPITGVPIAATNYQSVSSGPSDFITITRLNGGVAPGILADVVAS